MHINTTRKNNIYLINCVDLLIIASKYETQIIQIGKNLEGSLQLTNLGQLNYYLGIQINQVKDGIFSMNLEQYIEKILRSTGLQEAKP